MPSHPQLPGAGPEILVDVRGSGEWTVDVRGRERPLNVYRLGPDDWLVSEVGRSCEGRGGDLSRALAALAAGAALVVWGRRLADALDVSQGSMIAGRWLPRRAAALEGLRRRDRRAASRYVCSAALTARLGAHDVARRRPHPAMPT